MSCIRTESELLISLSISAVTAFVLAFSLGDFLFDPVCEYASLAKMLGGDAEGAKRILNDSPEKDTALGHYLMAIIGARTGNGEMVSNELKAAVAEDGTLKDKAMKDLEFRAYWETLSL